MKYLYDQPHEHHYVYIKSESVIFPHVEMIVKKDLYACLDCGLGMDIYNMDENIKYKEPTT